MTILPPTQPHAPSPAGPIRSPSSPAIGRGWCHCARSSLLLTVLLGGCAGLPQDVHRPVSHAYTDTEDTILGMARRQQGQPHPGKSGLVLLNNGLDAFVARAVLASAAERSIDAQYYLLHADLTGALFIDQLVKAADRGVRVRLLVDDMDLAGRDLGAAVLDSHPNIEVRLFNPFSRRAGRGLQLVTRFGSVTRRMHNKSFTADNQASILGGRNIGDEYFEANPELVFGDLDVLVIGPAVQQVSASFDSYWNSELAYPASVLKGEPPTAEQRRDKRRQLDELVAEQADSPYLQALRNSNLANQLRDGEVRFRWGEARIVADQPDKLLNPRTESQYHLAPMLRPYFSGVQEELIILSPYLVPGRVGTALLTQLSERGVRVRILTNSLASTDVPVVHAGYARYRKELLRAGVELYEVDKQAGTDGGKERQGLGGSSKASLHAKSFVFDRKHVFIGSLNLDPRSVQENTEIGVVFDAPEIGEQMGQAFDQRIDQVAFRLELATDPHDRERIVWNRLENGQRRVYSVEPHTGFWQRFSVGLLGVLPIESQL